MKMFLFLILALSQLNLISCVNWQKDDWAFACDFYNNDYKDVKSESFKCGPLCLSDSICTHFTWTKSNGGTCWMKKGNIKKSDAFDTNDKNMVCGIILRKMSQLIWSDEFNYFGKPSNDWTQEIGNNNGYNYESQYYTDFNANVNGKYLTILTERKNYLGFNYTSSRLVSKKNFTYGIFEMRAKLPKGRGTWPAFWLLIENFTFIKNYVEIDIMEHVGFNPNNIVSAIHYKAYSKTYSKDAAKKINDSFDTFNTYKLDWNSQRIIIYVNNQEYLYYPNHNNTWSFDKPMNIIINNAVGGTWGGKHGIDNSIFPTKYVIDYIRVYAANESIA